MEFSHVHVRVADLEAAVAWFRAKLLASPDHADDRMAMFDFGPATVVLDRADEDQAVTVAFRVPDCDAAFRDATSRGAAVSSAPEDKPWGVRSAYLRGPGRIEIEFEQPLGSA